MQVGGGVEIVRNSRRGNIYTMSLKEFGNLCSAVTHVDVISFISAYGLIVRVTFNTPDQFQLRSDITDDPVNELVFKCFFIQDSDSLLQPDPIPHVPTHAVTRFLAYWTGINSSSETYSKKSSTNSDTDNEYDTQRNIYDKTKGMSNPICPNALGLFKLNRAQFNNTFALKSPFNSNDVFKYLGAQLEDSEKIHPSGRQVGILVMESIPSTYSALARYRGDSAQYTTMCIHTSAVFGISFALAGFILIDAHLENWMVSKVGDVFALDVDKAINIDSATSFEALSEYATKTLQVYRSIPKSAQYLISPGITTTIAETVRAIRQCKTAWPINLIHKLFVLGAISECLAFVWGSENTLFRITGDMVGSVDCKIGLILGKVYANKKGEDDANFYKMSTILDINLDLDVYLAEVDDDEKQDIHSNLDRVSQYIAQRTMSRADTGRRGGSGSATRKPIKPITRRQYKTNRYRRGKKGKKSLKPKYLKRNRSRS